MVVHSAIWLPIFDELADPLVVQRLAAQAEESGWHGFFVWDHVRWRPPVRQVADPWITLAAVASATRRLRLGPLVTPLARRRPVKVARETATLDRLSRGRLTLGVGLGSDRFGEEFSRTGERVDDRTRAEQLDESLAVLVAAWSGEPVRFTGTHYTVDEVRFLPRPVQRPGVPIWVAGFPGNLRPLRRAALYDGFFPVNLESADQLASVAGTLASLRADGPGRADGQYDIAAAVAPGADPASYVRAGATWLLTDFDADTITLDRVHGVLRDGPYEVDG